MQRIIKVQNKKIRKINQNNRKRIMHRIIGIVRIQKSIKLIIRYKLIFNNNRNKLISKIKEIRILIKILIVVALPAHAENPAAPAAMDTEVSIKIKVKLN